MSGKIRVRTYTTSGQPNTIEINDRELESLADLLSVSSNGRRAISTIDLISHSPECFNRIGWRVEKLALRHGILLMSGLPKSGKSVVRAHLATCIALGAPFFGHNVESGRVLILAEEDDLHTERQRIIQFANSLGYSETDLTNQVVHVPPQGLQLDRGPDLTILKSMAADFDAVFIDPIIRFHSRDENSATDMQHVIRPLIDLGRERCVAISHHMDKKGKGPRGTGDLLASYMSKWDIKASREGDLSSIKIEVSLKLGAAPNPLRVGYAFDNSTGVITAIKHCAETTTITPNKVDYEGRILETITQNWMQLPNKEAVLNAAKGKRKSLSDAFDKLLAERRIKATKKGVVAIEEE